MRMLLQSIWKTTMLFRTIDCRISFLCILIAALVSAQEYPNRKPLGLFSGIDANIGYDLGAIIRTATENTENIYDPYQYDTRQKPGRLNYGFTYLAGYQPFSRFSFAGGFRYSYVDPNFHIIYALAQANVYLGPLYEEDFQYIFVRGGGMLNHSAVSNAGFFGVGFGKIEPLGNHFGHFFQMYIESQVLDQGTAFLGISYGIILFGNKR